MININYYWKIGKFIFDKNNKCLNITIKCSEFLSYYYGNSSLFSLKNMKYIKKIYLYFPIYDYHMEYIDWNCYKVLLNLNKCECYFYYYIVLFCNSNLFELTDMINNQIYFRI